jgi:transposase
MLFADTVKNNLIINSSKLYLDIDPPVLRVKSLESALAESIAVNIKLQIDNTTLRDETLKLQMTIAELIDINKRQSHQISQLDKRLNIDSGNSSMPSSRDIFGKKKTINDRDTTDKKSGGQPGHKGENLKFETNLNNIDNTVTHKPETCKACGSGIVEFNLIDTRQTHDVIIKKIITNHLLFSGICTCGCETQLNINVPHGVSYGNTIKSALIYLHNQDLIPTERLSQTSEKLFNIPVNESSIYNWQEQLAKNLIPYESEVKAKLSQQKTLHADESGIKAKGKKWLHVVCNEFYTFYAMHAKRGVIAMNEIGILNNFTGNLMHDCYKSYFTFTEIKHGLCNAHILRELKSIDQFYKLSFANKLRALLKQMNLTVLNGKEQQLTNLDQSVLLQYESQLSDLLALADIEALTLDNEKWRKDTQSFVKRVRKYQKEYLAFMYDFNMTFSNNQAERDIRMVKVKQKVSGGFRTEDGANRFLKIRGFISTMAKQSKDILTSIQKVMINPIDYNLSNST